MKSNLEALSAFQPTEFLLDTVRLDLDARTEIARVLRDWYKNDISSDFFTHNPIVVIKSDYGSVSRIAQELSVPRHAVKKKVRNGARSELETLNMLADDYHSFTWDQYTASPRGKTFMTQDADTSVIEVIQSHITGLDDDTFQEFKEEVAIKIKTELANTSQRLMTDFTPEQVNTVVLATVDEEVTKEAVSQAASKQTYDMATDRITKQGIPTKTEEGFVSGAVDTVLTKLGQVTMFLASRMAEKIDKKEGVKTEEVPTPESKPGYRPLVAPRTKQNVTVTGDTEAVTEQLDDLSFRQPRKEVAKPLIHKRTARKRLELDSDTDSDDYEEEEVGKVENISSYDASKEIDKIDTKSLPIWRHGETVEDRYFRLEEYISDLKAFMQLKYNIPDSRLIYSSLNASNRMHQRRDFPDDALSDINKFIRFLKDAYGRTELGLRDQLTKFERKSDENMFSYYQRLLTLYFNVKGTKRLTLDELRATDSDGNVIHQAAVSDIFHYFLAGLKNPRLEQALRMQLNNLCISTLAQTAQTMEAALLPETHPIQAVEVAVVKPEEKPAEEPLTETTLVAALQKVFASGRNNERRNVECYFCGKMGHYARDCRSRLNQLQRQNGNQGNQDEPAGKQTEQPKGEKVVTCHRCGIKGHVRSTCRVNLGKKLKR